MEYWLASGSLPVKEEPSSMDRVISLPCISLITPFKVCPSCSFNMELPER